MDSADQANVCLDICEQLPENNLRILMYTINFLQVYLYRIVILAECIVYILEMGGFFDPERVQ